MSSPIERALLRRPGAVPVVDAPAPPQLVKDSGPLGNSAEEGYNAAEGKDRSNDWLEFQPLKGIWFDLPFGQLRRINRNGPETTRVDLVYVYETVKLRGKNLDMIRTGILTGMLHLITQFNPDKHAAPADGQPVVESIELIPNGPLPELE